MIKTSFKIALLLISTTVFATEVIETGAVLGEYPVIRWMDNQRVIFLAASGQTCDRKDKPDSYKQPLNRIAIFDTRTRQLSWHGDVGVNGLCYADGNIAYARRLVSNGLCPKDDWIYLRGRFGEEKEQQPTTSVNTYSCLPEAEKNTAPAWLESAKKSGRVFRPLKPEHGWLEMGYADAFDSHHQRTYPLAIHPPGSEDKPYPIDQSQFRPWFEKAYSLHLLRYEPFKNAYLLAAPNGMDGHKEGALWWMYPDGRLEEFLKFKQQGEWNGVSYRNLIPTARDMLIVATKTPPQQNWGLYRVTAENRLEIVVKGWAEGGGKAVSPDGCKVAFGIDPRGYPNSRYQLQIVDVCERNPK